MHRCAAQHRATECTEEAQHGVAPGIERNAAVCLSGLRSVFLRRRVPASCSRLAGVGWYRRLVSKAQSWGAKQEIAGGGGSRRHPGIKAEQTEQIRCSAGRNWTESDCGNRRQEPAPTVGRSLDTPSAAALLQALGKTGIGESGIKAEQTEQIRCSAERYWTESNCGSQRQEPAPTVGRSLDTPSSAALLQALGKTGIGESGIKAEQTEQIRCSAGRNWTDSDCGSCRQEPAPTVGRSLDTPSAAMLLQALGKTDIGESGIKTEQTEQIRCSAGRDWTESDCGSCRQEPAPTVGRSLDTPSVARLLQALGKTGWSRMKYKNRRGKLHPEQTNRKFRR